MIRVSLLRICGVMVMVVALVACGSPRQAPAAVPTTPVAPTVTANDDFDRRALLTNMVETLILPLNQQLLTETQTLAQRVTQFAEQPTVETLTAAQAQWHTTAIAWARIEPFNLRFTMLVATQVKKWPINTGFIEKFIAEAATIDEPFIASIGSTAKGIAAIEYFLFSQVLTNAELVTMLTAAPPRMAYLVALSQNLVQTTAELHSLWSAADGNQAQAFIEADFSGKNVQGSISMLSNELIVLIETIVKTKLEYPLRGMLDEPQPDAVESPYAAYSWPLIVANLRTIQQIFHAGLGDYLDQLAVAPRDVPLFAAIDAQLEETIAAIEAIELPLRVAVLTQPDAVRAVRDHVKELLVLVKVDMANQLGITVTFSDNDGD